MTKTAEMLTAARAFTATSGGHREHVERGERVAADHPLVKARAPRRLGALHRRAGVRIPGRRRRRHQRA